MTPQQTHWFIWAALFAPLALYLGIALAGLGPSASTALEFSSLLAPALGIVATFQFGLTFVLRRLLLTGPIRQGHIDPGSGPGASKVQAAYIAIWAVSEAIAIYGLVLWLLSGRWDLFVPFLAAAALLFVFHAPRRGATSPTSWRLA